MKNSAHSVHPDVVAAIKALDVALAATYISGDFAYTLMVEGQVVASIGGKDDVTPAAWLAADVAEQAAKRAKKPEAAPISD